MVNEFQTDSFDFKTVSDIVDGPIVVTANLENVKLVIDINIKDILKLPFMLNGGGQMGYDSD